VYSRIFDTHVHFPRNWENPEADPSGPVEKLFERLAECNIQKAALLSGGMWGPSYEACLQLLRPYENVAVPVAVVNPEEQNRASVWKLYELGYRGLKMIGVKRDYDCPDYFEMYAAAEALEMPIVLHMGVIGGWIDFARTHPRRDPEAARKVRERTEWGNMRRDVSASRMHPFHLDTIANNFPRLKLIGAHLGGTGNYEAAASVARWRQGVFFDLSGGETIEEHAVKYNMIGGEIGVEKLTFGSDCGSDEIRDHVDRFVKIFDDLKLGDEFKERIWYVNAAEIFGLQPPALAVE
jgi:uncharacterized protein